MSKKTLIASLAALLLIGGVGFYVYLEKPALLSTTFDTSNTIDPGSVDVKLDGVPEGATVEITDRVNAERFDKTPRPTLDRVLPQTGVSAEAYAILKTKREGIVAEIEKNPASMTNWLALGTIHKQVNDYEGARIYYTYVVTVNPENLVAHWDLGVLYRNYLKNNTLAEPEFRSVIKLDAKYTDGYIALHELYVANGDATKAEAILKDGLIANPGDLNLLVAQAHFYAKAGDIGKAKESYDAAIAQAKKVNNQNLSASLQAEKDALR